MKHSITTEENSLWRRVLRTVHAPSLVILLLIFLGVSAGAQSTPSGHTTGFRYDLAGRLVGEIQPDPDGNGPLRFAAARNTYDSAGNLRLIETGELLNWQSEEIAPSSWAGFTVFQKTELDYDAMGREVKQVQWAGNQRISVSQKEYDVYGRLRCEAVRMNPAAFANPPSSACQPGPAGTFGPDRIQRLSYDNRDRLLEVERAVGTAIQQSYVTYTYEGSKRNPSTVEDANGNVARQTHDRFGQLQKWEFPSPETPGQVSTTDYEEYRYDDNGNLISFRKRDGRWIHYRFDSLNQLIQKDLPGATGDVFYGYDNRGLRLYSRFGSHSGPGLTTSYDGFGRPVTTSENLFGQVLAISYEYDSNGNRTSITHPDGRRFDYVHDDLDRIEEIWYQDERLVQVVYNRQGLEDYRAFGNEGASITADYDLAGRPVEVRHDLRYTSNDFRFGYQYNPASQLVGKSMSNPALQWQPQSQVNSYVVNGLNQYTSVSGELMSWDANGNLLLKGDTSYSFDIENRLISVGGDRNATLEYDPLGRLARYISNGVATRLVYDADALILEYDGAGLITKRYTHGNSVDAPLILHSGNYVNRFNRKFLHANHQGSIVALSDAQGNSRGFNSYDAYGVSAAENNGRFSYTGQIHLPEIGLYYYKARMYDPELGRFLQTDPVGYEDQINLYAYVANDPLNNTDPSGEFLDTVLDVANVVQDAGRLLGAAAAVGVGKAIGNDALVNEGLSGMADSSRDIAISAGAAVVPFVNATAVKGAAAASRHTQKLLTSPRKHFLDSVTDRKLRNRIDALYRPGATVGNGSTADAVRHELRTGELLSISGHSLKAIQMRNGLMKDLKSGRLNETDSAIARQILKDLQNALSGQ